MKFEFTTPRFTGRRFDEHTLPVEVARDLAAYEDLIIALAKHLFLLENKDRQRVPKGFIGDFHLHLEKIDEGSAKTVLAWVAAGTLALSGGSNSYLERARDLVAECIQAPDNALPEAFPRELLTHFNQLGRSLKEDEAIELALPNQQVATLTPERRKRLVLAADQFYEKEVDLVGSIGQVDFENESFRLRLLDGSQKTVPMPPTFRDDARDIAGKSRHHVFVQGVAAFDSWEKLQKITHVHTLEVQKNVAIAFRFDQIGTLHDGWDGALSKAPSAEAMAWVSDSFASGYPDELMLPQIVPTQEGNILVEWNTADVPSIDFDLNSRTAEFHSFGSDGVEIEQSFTLVSANDWESFWTFLKSHIQRGLA